LVNVKDVEYCDTVKDRKSAASKIIETVEDHMQGMVHDCPYLPGQLRMYNFTNNYLAHIDEMDKKGERLPSFWNQWFFKGDIRIKLKLKTDDDANVLDLLVAYTMNFRNADTF